MSVGLDANEELGSGRSGIAKWALELGLLDMSIYVDFTWHHSHHMINKPGQGNTVDFILGTSAV